MTEDPTKDPTNDPEEDPRGRPQSGDSASESVAGQSPKSRLVVLFSIIVVDLVGFGIVVPVLPYYAKTYDADGFTLGLLLASYSAMQFVFSPRWGGLSDRIGRRPVMLITVAGTAVSLVGLAFADSLMWIFITRCAAGCFGANITVATAYLTDVTDEEERTRWMGMVGASFAVGFTLGPAIGGLLGPFGYSVPILFAAGLAAINFVYAVIVLREPRVHRRRDSGGVGRLEILRTQPLIRRTTGIFFLFSLAVTQLEAMFPYFLMDAFGYDVRGLAVILVAMAILMGAIQGGATRRLVDRFGEKKLLVTGLCTMAMSFSLVPFSPTIVLLMVPVSIMAVGRAISQPSLMGIVSVASDPNQRGLVMGTFQSGAHVARVIGPPIAGALYDQWNAEPFVFAAIVALLAALACIPLPQRAVDLAQP